MRRPLIIAALLLSGCSLLPGIQAVEERLYRIPAEPITTSASERRQDVQLVIKDTHADVFLNSQKIIFSSDGIEQGYYQYASWAEPPPKRFATLLLLALEDAGIFGAVSSIAAGSIGNYQLNTFMLECYHDTSSEPGVARVTIRAELVEAVTRKLVAQTVFKRSVELKSFDARGAVDAVSAGFHQLIGDIVTWLGAQSYRTAVPVPSQPQ